MTKKSPITPAINMQTIFDAASEAGKSTAAGNDGIFHLAKVVYIGTRLTLITIKAKDPALRDVYRRYLEAANGSEFGAQVKTDSDAALKYGVSKLRVFAKFAGVNGPADGNYKLVKRAVAIINAQANADANNPERKPISRYENVLKVLRYATNAKKANLTDEEILVALAPKSSTKDPEYAALEQLASKAKKFAENASDNVVAHYFASILAEVDAQLDKFRAAYPHRVSEGDADDGDESDANDAAAMLSESDEEEAAA